MTKEQGMQYAGEFEVQECKLITHAGPTVDLTEILTEVNVYEELMSNSIHADISFIDDKDAISLYPIVGNEYIKLKIGTPDNTNQGKIDFTKHTFVVYKILQVVDVGQARTISLRLTTNEMFLNLRKRISQSYTGGYSDMIKKIFRDNNYLNSKKRLQIEDTQGAFSLIVPNMHPFDAINMISQRAYSKYNTTSYLFYETIRGYNFRSLEGLFERPSVFDFTPGEGGFFEKEGVNPQETNLGQVEDNQILSNNDILTNIKTGFYASKLIVHDIYNKSYSVKTFSYKDEFKNAVDIENLGGKKGYPLFPVDSVLDSNNNKVSDYSDSLVAVQSSSSEGNQYATSTYPNHRTPYGKSNPKEQFLKRFSKISQLNNGTRISLQAVGNTGLEVGDIITLSMPKSQTDGGELYDERLSGRYIISELRHLFKKGGEAKHRVGITVIKDSVSKIYPNDLPKMPTGTGGTINV